MVEKRGLEKEKSRIRTGESETPGDNLQMLQV